MSILSSNTDSPRVLQIVVLVTVGLVLGLVLSICSYLVFTERGQSQQDTSLNNSSESTPGFLFDVDSLLEQLTFKKTARTDFSTSDLRKISEGLQTFSTEELFKAISQSASLPYTMGLHTVQEMLCEYLVEKSPTKALESVWLFEEHRRIVLLRIVARHWVRQGLEEAVKIATELRQPYREIAFDTVFAELSLTDERLSLHRSSKDAEVAAIVARQTHERKIYDTISQDPSTAIDLLLSDDFEDFEQADLFSQAFSELFELEGFDAINKLNVMSYNSEFYDELFIQISAQDRVGMLGYLEGFSPSERPLFMYPLMEHWVEDDVESALEAIRNLSNPTMRTYAYSTLVSVWGWTRPLEVLNRIQELPREHRSGAVNTAVDILGTTNPDVVQSLFPSLKAIPGAINDENERMFVYSWSTKFPRKALEWVQEHVELNSVQRSRMLNRVLGEYALVQPIKAMEVAITEDPNPARGTLGLAFSVIDSLLQDEQIDTAIGLLDQVPTNTRAWVYATVAEKLVLEDRFDEVISLSEMLPAADKILYFRSVTVGLSSANSSDVLTLVANIADASLRSDLVNRILSDEWTTDRHFTEEQLKDLKAFVSEQ